jgi:uncharacterized membrane protein
MADDTANLGVLQPVVWDFASGSIAVVQTGAPATPANGIPAADLVPEDLPGLGVTGEFGAAFGNNNAGAIVGQSEDAANGPVRAVHWSPEPAAGGARTITALDATNEGAAFDINTSGRIVGERFVPATGISTAVFWPSATAPAEVLPVAVGVTSSTASSISDTNVIIGEVTDATGTHAVVWKLAVAPATGYAAPIMLSGIPAKPATATTPAVPALDGDSTAVAITGDTVIGEITDAADGIVHAVVWGGTLATTIPQDRGANTFAGGMSAAGRIVGAAGGNSALMNGAAPVRLHVGVASPTANGGANSINNSNRVVGTGNGKAFFATP